MFEFSFPLGWNIFDIILHFQYMKPHHVGRLKTWHSINTSNLEGHGGQPHGTNHTANDIYEDLFIRKFIIGVFHHQTVPEQGIAVLRRYLIRRA